jgi:hypothetical protein
MGGSPYVGVVGPERHVWPIMLFGLPSKQPPREAFATREEASQRLLQLVTAVAKAQTRVSR